MTQPPPITGNRPSSQGTATHGEAPPLPLSETANLGYREGGVGGEVFPKCLFSWVGVISSKFLPVPEMSLFDDFSDNGGSSLARQFQRGKRHFLPSVSVSQARGGHADWTVSELLLSDSVHSTKCFESEMTISLALFLPSLVSSAHLQPHPTPHR